MKSLKNYSWGVSEVGLVLGRATNFSILALEVLLSGASLRPRPPSWPGGPESHGEQEREKPGSHSVPLPGAADLGCGSPGEG